MTDIFTHSIILAHLEPKLKNDNLKVLDIGTGHGYLSFVIH
jgi:protein-L-isoaspartate O-methyltransferase